MENCGRNLSQQVLLLDEFVTLNQDLGHWNWYKMVLFVYPSSCLILGIKGRKSFLSVASLKAWVGGMLWVFSVSFTPSIQVFLGLPLALYPDTFVLTALLASWWVSMRVRCPNHLILCCWMWWRIGVVPTISLIIVFLILSHLVLLTALLRHGISQVVIFLSRLLVRVHVWLW